MNRSHNNFHDRLLGAEKLNDAFKAKYEKELKTMIEKKLTTAGKLGYVGWAMLGIGFFVLFGTMAIIAPGEFPMWSRFGFIAGAIFGLAWTVLALTIIKKGTINLKLHPVVMAGMGWGFVVILTTLFLVFGSKFPDKIIGIQMVVNVLPFLIMAAVFLIIAKVGRMRLETREKLLEIEYRLAELAEKMEKNERK